MAFNSDSFCGFSYFAALHEASSKRERISVLKIALISFDHHSEAAHDEEVKVGVVSTLCQHLKCVWNDLSRGDNEIERICRLLTMIYRCSDSQVASSLHENGVELLPVLIELMSHSGVAAKDSPHAAKLFERILSVDVSLREMKDSGSLMAFLLRSAKSSETQGNASGLLSVRALTALTKHQESKSVAMVWPGLFEFVVELARSSSESNIRLEAVRILENLAWDSCNKVVMGRNKAFVGALVKLTAVGDNRIKIHAFTTLKHLSVEAGNKLGLVKTANQDLLGSILVAIHENDTVSRKLEASQVLVNLICRETSSIVASYSELINRMASIVADKPHGQLAAFAAQALYRLSMYISVKHRHHQDLLKALVDMSTATNTSILMWTAKAFIHQTALTSSSFYIVRQQAMLQAILDLATDKDNPLVKAYALEALTNLAEDPANARKLAANSRLLETLVANVEPDVKNNSLNTRKHAVHALLCLASHSATTKRLAKQLGLVASLSRYGISHDNDVDLKRAALHAVLLLAPLM